MGVRSVYDCSNQGQIGVFKSNGEWIFLMNPTADDEVESTVSAFTEKP
jgi:hypothetical protein